MFIVTYGSANQGHFSSQKTSDYLTTITNVSLDLQHTYKVFLKSYLNYYLFVKYFLYFALLNYFTP